MGRPWGVSGLPFFFLRQRGNAASREKRRMHTLFFHEPVGLASHARARHALTPGRDDDAPHLHPAGLPGIGRGAPAVPHARTPRPRRPSPPPPSPRPSPAAAPAACPHPRRLADVDARSDCRPGVWGAFRSGGEGQRERVERERENSLATDHPHHPLSPPHTGRPPRLLPAGLPCRRRHRARTARRPGPVRQVRGRQRGDDVSRGGVPTAGWGRVRRGG